MITMIKNMKRTLMKFMAIMLCTSMALGFNVIPDVSFLAEMNDPVPAYLDTSLSYQERATDLVSRMSLLEKQA